MGGSLAFIYGTGEKTSFLMMKVFLSLRAGPVRYMWFFLYMSLSIYISYTFFVIEIRKDYSLWDQLNVRLKLFTKFLQNSLTPIHKNVKESLTYVKDGDTFNFKDIIFFCLPLHSKIGVLKTSGLSPHCKLSDH